MSNRIRVNKKDHELVCENCYVIIKIDDKFFSDDWGGWICLKCAKNDTEEEIKFLRKTTRDLQNRLEEVNKEMEA